MKKAWMLFLLGILLVGCGTRGKVPANEPAEETSGKGSGGIVAGEIEASLTEQDTFLFEYEVKNQTEKEVTLEFTSSQRFDYSVSTKDGKELFLFSSVASFLQVLGTETIKQGESLTYEIDLTDLNLEKGQYLLSAWMTPQDGPKYKTTTHFTVE
ncbi:hypothetical protein WQ57_23770 [Mesobacillus campisalis]|uniref:Intracellular proteinase inhibitor BsuPI domain-containing protein n=1 Tax=Mesobacillus campisalis TaxID=1408103 RepID=A0A0M2SFX9_9BACI|nr:BsuPI-related putative proteinase inhibitor [Mesobacillus campisalis]KKK33634.1 hypothetical protein WQ57_23770 [Mesobacillus campisalis]